MAVTDDSGCGCTAITGEYLAASVVAQDNDAGQEAPLRHVDEPRTGGHD